MNNLETKSDTVTVLTEEEAIREITEGYKEFIKNSLLAFKNAVRIGRALSDIKDNKPHGQFIPWVKKNVPFISERTARRYLGIYKKQDYLREKLGETLELKKAYALLTKKSEKPINPKTSAEKARAKLDSHLVDSIGDTRKRISLAKRKVLKGQPIPKREKKLLEKDTREKKERTLRAIEKARQRLEKLEQLLEKL